MKIEALKEYIRKTIKEEVRNVLKNELRNHLAEIIVGNQHNSSKPFIDEELVTSLSVSNDESTSVSSEPEVSESPKKFVKYTNNPVLNEILNQTKGGVPQEGGLVGMMGGLGQSGTESILESKVPESAPKEVKGVYQAMTRDYRGLLKAVDKKRSNKV